MLAALDGVAYVFLARSTRELLEPLLSVPEGQAAYAAAMRQSAATIALFDLPLIVIVGIAAYILARFSVRPLVRARTREERFAADAAHELRTPLATIAAVAQAARGNGETAQTAALAKITAVALDASALLGDLLALARDESVDTRHYEPVDLAALLAAVVRDAESSAPAVSVTIDVPVAGAYVVGDLRALRQLAHNLIVNALQHAQSRVTTGVRAEARAIVLWVEDDGAGVPLADRERVFERFYKALPTSRGNGLGLAICRHIATRHGGTIALEDRTRFVAHLPRAKT